MNRVLKLLIFCCILPTIHFGQISLKKSKICSSLRAEIPPENNYQEGGILNLELKSSDNSWSKLRRVELIQQSDFEFDNVPSGEYRVTLLRNSMYDVSKFELKNITSAPIKLECQERNLNNVLELIIHPKSNEFSFKG